MKPVVILLIVAAFSNAEPTFNKVKFKGYSVFTLKFEKTITAAETLKDQLPAGIYDHVEFIEQNIPRLKENSIKDIEDLDELTMENCKIEIIEPGAFKNLPLLRKLTLKGNKIEEVPEGVFNNLKVSMLDLSRNRIKSIAAEALSNMPSLLNINLADNLIQAWDQRWFYNVPLLTRVSMQNNSLDKIGSKAFVNLKGNKKFGTLQLTLNLVFSHNKISKIEDDAFEGVENIKNLWLDHNQLLDFPDNLLEKVTVSDLSIGHNHITCINGDFNKIFKPETTVNLDGNPLDCDCLERIKKWTKKHNRDVDMFISEMNCLSAKLRQKMDALQRRLKELNGTKKEVEEVTSISKPEDQNEVEVLFK